MKCEVCSLNDISPLRAQSHSKPDLLGTLDHQLRERAYKPTTARSRGGLLSGPPTTMSAARSMRCLVGLWDGACLLRLLAIYSGNVETVRPGVPSFFGVLTNSQIRRGGPEKQAPVNAEVAESRFTQPEFGVTAEQNH